MTLASNTAIPTESSTHASLATDMENLAARDEQPEAGHEWNIGARERDIDFGTNIQENEDTTTERDYRNPKGDPAIKFCLDNKKEILDLHSSIAWTKVFELECDLCERFYKHCMFSKAEQKGDHGYTACRWCQLDKGMSIEWDQFSIHTHIHCNRPGMMECGLGSMSLVRPIPILKLNANASGKKLNQEKGLRGLAAPEVVVRVVEKKMSQKERKRAQWEARAMGGV
ncbi:hypothetical protein IFR05_017475 [Cadophora sp. M221]|nr:hypothetical protein IFR05_017475 [Cadophora sp. M221]